MTLATVLCAAGLAWWGVLLVRLHAEAPILAFGRVAPQLERLTALIAAYYVVGAVLLGVTVRLGWLARRELARGRRSREAERLLEN